MITRTVNSVRNVKWGDPTGYRIDMEVDFDELDDEFVPFTAVKESEYTPDYAYSHDLFNRAVAGEFGEIAEYIPPSNVTGDEAMSALRSERDELLKTEVDPIVSNPLRWESMTAEKQQEWSAYRQALLDLPNNSSNVEYTVVQTIDSNNPTIYTTSNVCNVVFPTKPE